MGEYGNDTDRHCYPCNSICIKCYGPDNGQCIECNPITAYLDPRIDLCVTCPEGNYGSNDELQCLKCHETCLSCSGPLEN